MTSPGAEQNIAPGHQEWLDENTASMILDGEALQARAEELRVSIAHEPHVFVGGIGSWRQDESHIIVNWPVPNGPLLHDEHQRELSGALDVSLLTIRQEARRRSASLWSFLLGICGGVTVTAIGEQVIENDLVSYGGMGMTALGVVTLTLVNTRDKPKPPEDAPERPALRLERRGTDPIA